MKKFDIFLNENEKLFYKPKLGKNLFLNHIFYLYIICISIYLFFYLQFLFLIRTAGTAFFYYVKIWKSSVFKKLYIAYLNFIIKFTNVLGNFVQFKESLIVFGLERFRLERGDCISKKKDYRSI